MDIGVIVSVLVHVLISCLCVSFGYYLGRKAGVVLGMQQVLSIIKVYDADLLSKISKLFSDVSKMEPEDRENKFIDYLEKYSDALKL